MGAYNDRHPRGIKLKLEEIRARREQIYDKYTWQYLAPLHYEISHLVDALNPRQDSRRTFPDVSFCVVNLSDYLWTKFTVQFTGLLNAQKTDLELRDKLYRAEKQWSLNPKRQVNGHFKIMSTSIQGLQPKDRLEIRIQVAQEDTLGRRHELLPDGYVYKQEEKIWYFEP